MSRFARALSTASALLLAAGLLTACGNDSSAADDRSITVWSLENVSGRLETTRKILERFTAETGIQVKLVGVDEPQLSQLVMSAAAAGRLPDVIGAVPLAAIQQLSSNGLLNPDAANQVVADLGETTFDPRALELTREGDRQLAVPSDSWTQLLYYRKDLFAAAGLPAPTTYADIEKAAQTLDQGEVEGISVATDPADPFTQQSFEHLALANNCQLVDGGGKVTLDSPGCREAFRFYGDLATRYSAAGTQTVDSTRASYFAGKSAMVVWSSFLLDELAGLREDALPSCEPCAKDKGWLARNTGVVTAVQGPDSQEPAQFGELNGWAVTKTAKADASRELVRYMLDQGYEQWFGMAAEGKFPVRHGTAADPTRFDKVWNQADIGVDARKPLAAIYPPPVIAELREGVGKMQRWGITEGQGALVGATLGELPVPKAISALASGQLDAGQAAEQATDDVAAIQDSLG
ncbi:extracellular solute-binding protein family 1 [Kribbella flavida DSM 17836]|uniref:Extracellular solute-binding protein family 1 n=1 Tax=Kribbella flavida (strain DSM 17836 / JCM 10339 / NBRC 14399) TaxID=479435 RepID=D2Q0T9_KRIFD|nr:extracellular solute-binding protein [Kribbella flavida]ADB33889.1 extracellular solute-binding protein family 1 [Kribbella flavida DSM 17836]